MSPFEEFQSEIHRVLCKIAEKNSEYLINLLHRTRLREDSVCIDDRGLLQTHGLHFPPDAGKPWVSKALAQVIIQQIEIVGDKATVRNLPEPSIPICV